MVSVLWRFHCDIWLFNYNYMDLLFLTVSIWQCICTGGLWTLNIKYIANRMGKPYSFPQLTFLWCANRIGKTLYSFPQLTFLWCANRMGKPYSFPQLTLLWCVHNVGKTVTLCGWFVTTTCTLCTEDFRLVGSRGGTTPACHLHVFNTHIPNFDLRNVCLKRFLWHADVVPPLGWQKLKVEVHSTMTTHSVFLPINVISGHGWLHSNF